MKYTLDNNITYKIALCFAFRTTLFSKQMPNMIRTCDNKIHLSYVLTYITHQLNPHQTRYQNQHSPSATFNSIPFNVTLLPRSMAMNGQMLATVSRIVHVTGSPSTPCLVGAVVWLVDDQVCLFRAIFSELLTYTIKKIWMVLVQRQHGTNSNCLLFINWYVELVLEN